MKRSATPAMSPEDIREAVRLAGKGVGVRELARRLGWHHRTIGRAIAGGDDLAVVRAEGRKRAPTSDALCAVLREKSKRSGVRPVGVTAVVGTEAWHLQQQRSMRIAMDTAHPKSPNEASLRHRESLRPERSDCATAVPSSPRAVGHEAALGGGDSDPAPPGASGAPVAVQTDAHLGKSEVIDAQR